MNVIKCIVLGILVTVVMGCNSTSTSSQKYQTSQTVTVPEAYQVMADFDIISQRSANEMARNGKMALEKNINNFNSSVLGQVTNNGSMLLGFTVAQLFGGGVSLMDFFNPSLGFRSTAHENKLKKPYLFVPVDKGCNKQCANEKLMEIIHTIALYTAENYAKHLQSIGVNQSQPIQVGPVKEVEYDHLFRKVGMFGKISWAYDVEFTDVQSPYDHILNLMSFFAVYNADFFTSNGQRYYGSKISTTDGYNIFLRLLGWPETRVRDNSMVVGMTKASEKHDFIYIETLRGFLKNAAGEYTGGKGVQNRSIGDFMIKDGTYTQLGIYPHPDNQLKDLDKMNHLGIPIKHALDDLMQEVISEQVSSSDDSVMTPSSQAN